MFSPVKKYKEDHQYMDGVVCENGDGILLAGFTVSFLIVREKCKGATLADESTYLRTLLVSTQDKGTKI